MTTPTISISAVSSPLAVHSFGEISVGVWDRITDPVFRSDLIELSRSGYSARSGVLPQAPEDGEIDADLLDPTVIKYCAREESAGELVGLMTTHTDPDRIVWVNEVQRDWYRAQPEPLCCVSSVVVNPAYFSAGVGQALLMAGALYTDTLGGGTVRVEVDYCLENEQIIPGLIESARSRLDAELGFDSQLSWKFHGTHELVRVTETPELSAEEQARAREASASSDPGEMFGQADGDALCAAAGALSTRFGSARLIAVPVGAPELEDLNELIGPVGDGGVAIIGTARCVVAGQADLVLAEAWRMAQSMGASSMVIEGPRGLVPARLASPVIDATTYASLYFDMRR